MLENVQKRAVKMISGLQEAYEEKSMSVGMVSLEENIVRGDMIAM